MNRGNSVRKVIFLVRDLKKYFPVKRGLFSRTTGYVKAVDGVSLDIEEGKTTGLVGESGCGKSTLARSIVRLIPSESSKMYFLGRDLASLRGRSLRWLRKDLQIIFQDPYNSLDPRFTVYDIVKEGLESFSLCSGRKDCVEKVKDILELTGLPLDSLSLYPHEFSGGQRQRINLARSLVLNPKMLILDEPVSSLDVSVQAQVLNLILDLQEKFRLTYLFISHDLNVIRAVSDTVCVMYRGKIVEEAESEEFFSSPLHPYSRLLLAASRREKAPDIGNNPSFDGKGCIFKNLCPEKKDICETEMPPLFWYSYSHNVSCWLYEKS